MRQLNTHFQICAACCFFILAGLAIIPYAGIQNDESIFASPLYLQNPKEFCFIAFHRTIPLMVMTYIGTLKTLIYVPILGLFGATAWSVRVPVVLIAALTIFFLYKLTAKCADSTAGLMAGFLLATDPIFILTSTIDWGPVVLGQFFLVTGCYSIVQYAQSRGSLMRDLAPGFFFFGLALWNKALFFWVLAGLAAGAIFFLPEIRRLLTLKSAATAAVAFLLGAAPFLMYNIRHPNATLSTSAHFDPPKIAFMKLPALEASLDGSGLLGYFTTEKWETQHPKTPSSIHGRLACWIEQRLGEHRHSGMEYAMGLTLLLLPWWWRKRAAWFALVFMSTVWLLMAFTKDAGGSVHHAVLLWPFPHFFLGVVLSSIPWRRAAWLAATVLVAMNLLVLNTYITAYERYGAGNVYTDAMFPLSAALKDSPDPDHRVWIVDWGMLNSLALLHQGRIELRVGDPPFMTANPSPDERKTIDYMLNDRDALFVGHVAEREIMKGVRNRMEQAIAAAGFHKEIQQTIADSNGRPVFEIFRIVP